VPRLAAMSGRVVLGVDAYEAFRVSDTWLRREFLPGLSSNTRLVVMGRDLPSLSQTVMARLNIEAAPL